MIVNRPAERAAIASARAARWSARGSSRRQVAGGHPWAIASSVTSSDRSSLRSIFRCRGDLVVTARTCSATFPSIRRGTSTWPRSARLRRSRPHSSESACRSAIHRRSCRARARSDAWYGAAFMVRHRRASVRPTSARPPARVASGRHERRTHTGRGHRPGSRQIPRADHVPLTPDGSGTRTSSRKARERASRSRASRTNSRRAASVSRSIAGARRSAAIASMSSRW